MKQVSQLSPTKTLRVFYITPEEPFHLPVFFDTVFGAQSTKVIGIAIVRALYKNQTWFSQSKRFIKAFGLRTFLVEAFMFALYKALDITGTVIRFRRFYSVRAVALHHKCAIFEPVDINAPSFLATLRELAPDVIVSVSNPQIFKDEIMSIPSWGCINNHGALLPKYRGVLPSFWMLAHNEKKAGVTVHYLSKEIDEGSIIVQKEFDILPEDTLHTLITRSKRLGAEALIEALDQIASNTVSARPNLVSEGSYYSWPTREAVEKFRKLGRRFR
jgi:methionyl-tRNA formyltransferase